MSMSKRLTLIYTLVFFLLPSFTIAASSETLAWPSLSSFYYDYKARSAIENKKPEEALEFSLKILENEPMQPQIHSNIGAIFEMLQKKDESGQSFAQSLKLLEQYKDQLLPVDLFQIYYNLGVYHGAQKEIEKALDFYQKALDVNPASIETKHNIELLIQQQQSEGQGEQNNKEQENKDQNGGGQGEQNKDPKDGDQKDEEKNEQQKDQSKDRKQTPKYQPRAFKGEQLTEGDVKKILGELSQQDKKIRSNFDKKERKEDKNDKDW